MFDFNKLFGGGGDNFLLNAKEITRILDSLSTGDPVHALDEITHWLDFLATSSEFKLRQRINLATRFNQAAQPHARKLLTEYVQTSRMNKSREEIIFNACAGFFLAAFNAHTRCVADHISQGRIKISETDIATSGVRGMRALGMLAHWMNLRYRQPLPESIWDKMYVLFNIAEQGKFCRTPVMLNPQYPAQTSVLMEMVKILMMEVSTPGRLTKSHIELARQVIEEFAFSFVWENVPAGETVFYIDFSLRKPPVRLTHVTHPHFMARCFGPGDSVPALVGAIKQLEFGGIPKEVDIHRYPDYKRQDLLEVFLHLSQAWSKLTPQDDHSHFDKRKHERRKFFSHFEVIHGLKDIHTTLLEYKINPDKLPTEMIIDKLSNNEFVYDFGSNKIRPAGSSIPQVEIHGQEKIHTESWVAENESEAGYGLTIPELMQDWVQARVMLGLRLENADWIVGVLRRVEMGSKDDTHVGIILLSRAPEAVTISPLNTQLSVWENAGETLSLHHTNALLLRADPPLLEEDGLILPAGSYDLHKTYELVTREGKKLIRLDFCRYGYQDADHLSFSLINPGRK
jgi:hypothetical protein